MRQAMETKKLKQKIKNLRCIYNQECFKIQK